MPPNDFTGWWGVRLMDTLDDEVFMKKIIANLGMAAFLVAGGCAADNAAFDVDRQLAYCMAQVKRELASLPNDSLMPRTIERDSVDWRMVPIDDWTSGFWPGTLWYAYEYSKDPSLKEAADRYTRLLTPLSVQTAYDHDIGFQVFCSFGNGERIAHLPGYREVIVRSADTLATLFNPRVGTILSWPREVERFGGNHNTIIDNMINLEMLFWASKNGGDSVLYHIADSHARTTMANHFRADGSTYHVVLYDMGNGERTKGITHQGYADGSMWARGQAWAIYGYTMVYRETRDTAYLRMAQKAADVYLSRLPADMVPYWDFDAPNIPDAPRDASAAAVTASALLELSSLVPDFDKAELYFDKAKAMLAALSTPAYQSGGTKSSFLLHSTGHYPNGTEIDASINYADYYYIEALLRYKKLKEGRDLWAVL
ncbi:MAG: glycoside hydrolase family 88 protein [Breznakibacter sp.]